MSELPKESKANSILVWAIIISQFAPPFMFSGVAVALPSMGRDLEAGAVALGLVETLFLTSQLSFLLPIGRLADASDKRTLYKYAFLVFWIASFLIAISSSMTAILALRFVQGICSAVFASTGGAIIAELVPPERRGRMYGYSIGAIYAGLAAGPVCAGLLIEYFGWRGLFFTGGALLFAGHMLVQAIMKSEWKTPPRDTVHLPSAFLIVASVLGLVGGTALISTSLIGYAAIFASFILILSFVIWQGRLEKPLVNFQKLKQNLALRNALLVQVLLYMNAFCAVFMLSIYMQVSLGHSANLSGQILAIGSLLMVVIAPFAGRLSDRFRPRYIATIGVACVCVSSVMALFLTGETKLGYITLLLFLNGLGFGLFSTPNTTIIMGSVPQALYGMASALSAKARSLGMMSGMLITSLLMSLHIGNEPVEQHAVEFIGIMHEAFVALTLATFLAIFVSYKGRRVSN